MAMADDDEDASSSKSTVVFKDAYMSKVDNGMVFEVWTLLSLVCELQTYVSLYAWLLWFFKHGPFTVTGKKRNRERNSWENKTGGFLFCKNQTKSLRKW